MTVLIDMSGIVKEFPTQTQPIRVLKSIDLQIRHGEFVSIMGPSGSGKTTLASILGCLASPSGGSYKIEQREVGHMQPDQLSAIRNRMIGYVFQDFNLLDGISALDNVALPLVYAGVPLRQRHDRAAHVLKLVGLGEKMNSRPNQLSGGQKQRVAIARALVNQPKLIFADEPTGALDQKTSYEIMTLLQQLNMAGHTIVQVTHSERDARFSKRIVHIMDGLIIKDEFVENFTIGLSSGQTSREADPVASLWRIAQDVPESELNCVEELRRLYESSQTLESFIESIKALARSSEPRLNRIVMKLFRHEHWAVRAEVVRASTVSKQDYALGFFVAALKDANPWVRFLAISQLRKLEPDFLMVGEESIRRSLADSDERVRAAAVSLIGAWGEARFLDTMTQMALEDPVARVRSNAFDTLQGIVKAGAAPSVSLLKGLTESSHRVRSTAAARLFKWFPQECLAAIAAMLTDVQPMTRAAAAWSLGVVGDERGVELLLAQLALEQDPKVQRRIEKSLAERSVVVPLSEQINRLLPAVSPASVPLAG